MTGRLDGYVAAVTGAGKGIGRAVVDRFVDEGAHVAALVRSEADAERLVEAHGTRVAPLLGDVRKWQSNADLVGLAVEKFGKLDCLVPNAGVYDFSDRLDTLSGEDLENKFRQLFDINVCGYILAARAGIDALRASNGSIIYTLSSSSFYAGGGGALYVASKHAGVGLVRQLAFELAPEIRVNAVAPGATKTSLGGIPGDQSKRALSDIDGLEAVIEKTVPLGFMSEPEDHTDLYVTLAARAESRFITSEIIRSDGGLEVRGGGRRRRQT